MICTPEIAGIRDPAAKACVENEGVETVSYHIIPVA
jgi:hypothetical protein